MGYFAYYNFTQCFEGDYITGLVRNSGMFWEPWAFVGYILIAFVLNIRNLVPANDPYLAAYSIQLLCNNRTMNIGMGKKAKTKVWSGISPIRS